MINASFSSADDEPSMQERLGNCATNFKSPLISNHDHLPSQPSANNQNSTELEDAAVNNLLSLNGNNGKRKADESEKRIMVIRGGPWTISITTGSETECETF